MKAVSKIILSILSFGSLTVSAGPTPIARPLTGQDLERVKAAVSEDLDKNGFDCGYKLSSGVFYSDDVKEAQSGSDDGDTIILNVESESERRSYSLSRFSHDKRIESYLINVQTRATLFEPWRHEGYINCTSRDI